MTGRFYRICANAVTTARSDNIAKATSEHQANSFSSLFQFNDTQD